MPREKPKHERMAVNVDKKTVEYFKSLEADTGIPYVMLINMCLKDAVDKGVRPNVTWKGEPQITVASAGTELTS